MGAWDAYIGNNATGDNTYMNQKLVHTKDPFQIGRASCRERVFE